MRSRNVLQKDTAPAQSGEQAIGVRRAEQDEIGSRVEGRDARLRWEGALTVLEAVLGRSSSLTLDVEG